MSDAAHRLHTEGKISRREYQLYLWIEGNDVGRQLVPELMMDCLRESPETIGTSEAFVHHQGRLSVWRDLEKIVKNVKKKMEDYRNERDTASRSRGRNPTEKMGWEI